MPDREKELRELYEKLFSLNTSVSLRRYSEIIMEARVIFEERNALYGDAFKETGVYGTLAVLIGDVARVKNMVFKDLDFSSENLESMKDKLLDIVNQSVITIMMIEDDNWTGEEDEHNGK